MTPSPGLRYQHATRCRFPKRTRHSHTRKAVLSYEAQRTIADIDSLKTRISVLDDVLVDTQRRVENVEKRKERPPKLEELVSLNGEGGRMWIGGWEKEQNTVEDVIEVISPNRGRMTGKEDEYGTGRDRCEGWRSGDAETTSASPGAQTRTQLEMENCDCEGWCQTPFSYFPHAVSEGRSHEMSGKSGPSRTNDRNLYLLANSSTIFSVQELSDSETSSESSKPVLVHSVSRISERHEGVRESSRGVVPSKQEEESYEALETWESGNEWVDEEFDSSDNDSGDCTSGELALGESCWTGDGWNEDWDDKHEAVEQARNDLEDLSVAARWAWGHVIEGRRLMDIIEDESEE